MASTNEDPVWVKTLERVLPAILAVRVSHPIAFNHNKRKCSVATGFIVESRLGIVLTNRHVIDCSPVLVNGTFTDGTEIDLYPLYSDPVHDFAFLKFDPSRIPAELFFTQIDLNPQGAKIGVQIRVVGNDNAEGQIVLPGVLAKLNRNPTSYDLNTFYFAAANNTSGGSSGSPVINIEGCAVGLNSGGAFDAATSYFLPLDAAHFALQRIKETLSDGNVFGNISRGDLLVSFKFQTPDEALRLGMDSETVSTLRAEMKEEYKGFLVVNSILKPLQGIQPSELKVGDILISINGKFCNHFYELECVLNDHVHSEVVIQVQRCLTVVSLKATVYDLHQFDRNELVIFADSVFHEIPYLDAISNECPLNAGIYIAEGGLMLNDVEGCIITSVGCKRTTNLAEFTEALLSTTDNDITILQLAYLSSVSKPFMMEIFISKKYYDMFRKYSRCNDGENSWIAQDITTVMATERSLDHNISEVANTSSQKSLFGCFLSLMFKLERNLFSCWRCTSELTLYHATTIACKVDFLPPYPYKGFDGILLTGLGLIVDSVRGLVFTSRSVIPHAIGAVRLHFVNASNKDIISVNADVVFLHPTRGYALVHYDPSGDKLKGLSIKSAKLSATSGAGQKVTVVSMSLKSLATDNLTISTNTIAQVLSHSSKTCGCLFDDILSLTTTTQSPGIIFASDGSVLALNVPSKSTKKKSYLESKSGNHINMLTYHLTPLLSLPMLPSSVYELPCKFSRTTLWAAKHRGISSSFAKKLESKFKEKHLRNSLPSILEVIHGRFDTPVGDALKPGDLILSINGKIVITFSELHEAIEDSVKSLGAIDILVLRNRQEILLEKVQLHKVLPTTHHTFFIYSNPVCSLYRHLPCITIGG